MHTSESAEDYLEAILVLSQKLPVVRSVDIANHLGFSKPSVSIAMKNLRQKQYIEFSPDGYITLTESGMQVAACTYEKHVFLTKWLTNLGVDPNVAAEDACKMEHDISPESFAAIKAAYLL